MEDLKGKSIDEEIGTGFDIALKYHLGKHFALGNVLTVFFPGDGIEDLYGSSYDDNMYVDTVELEWKW